MLELDSAKDQGTAFFFTIPLEEVISTEANYSHAFSNITIGKYEQDIPSKLDNYLDEYFQFFGPKVERFESIGDLKELEAKDICKNYWIDIDKAKQNIIEAIHHMDKSKLIVIANLTSRNKLEKLGIEQSNVIFKPITLSKLKNILSKSSDNKPTLESIEDEVVLETKFDADVLVTEDNMINQKLIKRILEEHGIRVDIANNGLESFEKRRNGSYDLIFMDIQMPVMDGIEATREILDYEEDEELTHIPIVALTANALKGDRERFLAEGMDEYITKPIETTELLYILNRFLASKVSKQPKKPKPEKEKVVKKVVKKPATKPVAKVEAKPVAKAVPKATPKPVAKPAPIAKKGKKILLAKKFLLEKRVLAKVFDNLKYEYDILSDMNILESKLQSDDYDIVFADIDLINDSISNTIKNVAIILSGKSSNGKEPTVTKGERLLGTPSKEDISNIITKYRG